MEQLVKGSNIDMQRYRGADTEDVLTKVIKLWVCVVVVVLKKRSFCVHGFAGFHTR